MAARHPLPYLFAKTQMLLLEQHPDEMVLRIGESPARGALAEVLRLFDVDRIERELHGLWRTLPRPVAGLFGPAYFGLRRRFGTPGWRTFYSRAELAAQKDAADEIRRTATIPAH